MSPPGTMYVGLRHPSPPTRGRARRPLLRRISAALAVGLALCGAVGPAAARADVAFQQWLPTAADLVRTLRPCPRTARVAGGAVCWSVREDLSAWMALPPGSPYPWGQCTYYVGLRRPDIWNDRASPSVDPPADWDAWTWATHAQAEGLAVDGQPRPGDVMVYSRRAIGSDSGHVAIVDAVGGTDTSTGDLLVTVSEMNVEGLDDPAAGEGDTTTLQLPRAQLVPGLIQFIHLPSPGYAAPVWADGTGAPAPGVQARAAADPSLAVGMFGDRLETVSDSPALEHVVISSGVEGHVVSTFTLAANRVVALHLSTGRYRVCVTQSSTGSWMGASRCAQGAVPESGRAAGGRRATAARRRSANRG